MPSSRALKVASTSFAVGSVLAGVRLAGAPAFCPPVSSVCCASLCVAAVSGFFAVVFGVVVLVRVVVDVLEFCAKPVTARAQVNARMANNFFNITFTPQEKNLGETYSTTDQGN